MVSVLIVDDDAIKFGRMHEALVADGVSPGKIQHAVAATQALEMLRATQFDLLLLDVNLPRRLGEQVERGGGLDVLRELERYKDDYHRPRYIVGVTAYEDVLTEFGGSFEEQLWSLILYNESSDRWISQLRSKLTYIGVLDRSRNLTDGTTYGTDLAVVCALDTVEFDAVRRLPCDWTPLRLRQDEARYLSGSIHRGDQTFSVIAAAAPRMGMPASAVLASKMIHQFRPRYLAMVGICAGRASEVKIGDIVVADPTWDWGSGKIVAVDNQPQFRPSPHQLDMDPDLATVFKELSENTAQLSSLRADARGKKPPFELRVIPGPMASGAAVVAHKPTLDGVAKHNRELLAIDMEAYGVATAAVGSGRPRPMVMLIKGVCDYADKDKDDDYQEYAASVAAGFLLIAARKFL